MKTHVENGKQIICNVCQKQFKSNGELKSHMNVHVKEKAYNCLLCDSTFGLPGNLKQHIDRIHKKENSHYCVICDKIFSTTGHGLVHTGE